MVAAQQSFMIADEALFLAESLSYSSPAKHHDDLLKMLSIATRGHHVAQLAYEKFKDIRSKISQVLEKAEYEHDAAKPVDNGGGDEERHGMTELELQIGILLLEDISDCVTTYISRWSMMEMSGKAQVIRTETLVLGYHSLRENAVITKWKDMRREYLEYTHKTRIRYDIHSRLFDNADPSKLTGTLKPMRHLTSNTEPEGLTIRRYIRQALKSGKKVLLVFVPSEGLKLELLALSTQLAFETILPWCNHGSEHAQRISDQMKLYAQAIDLSICSAQDIFTLAEDALTLATFVTKNAPKHEVQEYLQGMLTIAQDGQQRCHSALDRFTGLIEDVQGSYQDKSSKKPNTGVMVTNTLSELEKCIPILEAFVENVSCFSDWWQKTAMSLNSQNASAEAIIACYSSLRKKQITSKWAELKTSFARYADKIRLIQDQYPTLFEESRKLKLRT
ncbi:hypothetical protein B0H34DRAFT_802581 [Crassisporium funariophilum]|nr:hypothetical protein B0H34DRAFT_802581 [Crassisporium funariophilum]